MGPGDQVASHRLGVFIAAARHLPTAAALALVTFVFGVHTYLTFRYQYLNPFSIAEEWAYTNIAARNFLHYGFLNTLFLQDMSASAYPEDHPYVYNHMPAGPDITTAALLWLTGNDYQLTRLLFALTVLPGLYYFVRFTQLLLGRMTLQGAPLAIFITGPLVLIGHLEQQIHSPFLLLGFAPLVWLTEHAQRGGAWRVPAAATALFVLSIYVQYVLVATIVFALVYLYVLKLVEIRSRHVLVGVGAVAAGILLHLFQNYFYFGGELFYRELLYTLGNRAIGFPSKDELNEFYQTIGVVHHGQRSLDHGLFSMAVIRSLLVPQWRWLLALLLVSAWVSWRVWRNPAQAGDQLHPLHDVGKEFAARFRHVVKMYIWATLTVVSVLSLFPAFAQELNFARYGVNYLLLAIPSVALIVSAIELSPLIAFRGKTRTVAGFPHHATGQIGIRYAYLLAVGACFVVLLLLGGTWALPLRWQIAYGLVFVLALGWAIVWARAVFDTEPAAGHSGEKSYLPRLLVFVIAAGALAAITVKVLTDAVSVVRTTRMESYLEPMTELKQFKGNLFLTNINHTAVAFFVEGAGYGVCDLDAIAKDGHVVVDGCKVAHMKRHEYWRSQGPDHFYFFWNGSVFPGFSDCLPVNSGLPVEVVAGDCLSELRRRLHSHYPVLHRNSLFEVYDLRTQTQEHSGRRRVR